MPAQSTGAFCSRNPLDALLSIDYFFPRMFETFLQPASWFTLRSAEVGGLSGKMIFGFFAALFVIGIVCRMVSSRKTDDRYIRTLGERCGTMLLTMGFLGVLFYFFSFERIRLFGARFWYLLWLIGFATWTFFLARFARKTIPFMKEREQRLAEQRKYFPPRKKKK